MDTFTFITLALTAIAIATGLYLLRTMRHLESELMVEWWDERLRDRFSTAPIVHHTGLEHLSQNRAEYLPPFQPN